MSLLVFGSLHLEWMHSVYTAMIKLNLWANDCYGDIMLPLGCRGKSMASEMELLVLVLVGLCRGMANSNSLFRLGFCQ